MSFPASGARAKPDDASDRRWVSLKHGTLRLLLGEDLCPECLGQLDTGFECLHCGFDALPIQYYLGEWTS
jgi:hypothetical protein